MPSPQVKSNFLLKLPDGNCSELPRTHSGKHYGNLQGITLFPPSLQNIWKPINACGVPQCLPASPFPWGKGSLQPSPLKTKWKASLKLGKSNLEMHYRRDAGSLINMMLPLHLLPNEWGHPFPHCPTTAILSGRKRDGLCMDTLPCREEAAQTQ